MVTSGGTLLREILLEESAESASLFNVAATGLQNLLDGNDYLTPRLTDAIQQMREQFDRQQQDAEQQLSCGLPVHRRRHPAADRGLCDVAASHRITSGYRAFHRPPLATIRPHPGSRRRQAHGRR
ncbi:MAG: hypothetical protein R3E84_19440 [Pseudomonadales bacterium]